MSDQQERTQIAIKCGFVVSFTSSDIHSFYF